jgi:hypothetical protein
MQRRRALPAACAVVLLVVAQLLGLAHETQARHIVCAKHGEQLEAAVLVGGHRSCERSHWIGVEGDTGGHSECEITRALHQSAATSKLIIVVATSPTTSTTVLAAPTPVVRQVVVYRAAPKTSPPA